MWKHDEIKCDGTYPKMINKGEVTTEEAEGFLKALNKMEPDETLDIGIEYWDEESWCTGDRWILNKGYVFLGEGRKALYRHDGKYYLIEVIL